MIQPILIGISLLASFLGFVWNMPVELKPYTYDDGAENVLLGATNFPTSLDSLTNPGATDSVAVVSHSAQHSNANDAIEAIEAKVGTGASTPLANTIFAGIGTGSSAYVTHATATQFTATNFLANGSSTLQNLTFVNATGTSATTTNIFSTTASSTNLYGAGLPGSGCAGSNFLQWTAGSFSCGAAATGLSTFSTTTTVNMATTTIRSNELPSTSKLSVTIIIPAVVGTATTTADVLFAFDANTGGLTNVHGYASLNGDSTNVDGSNANFIPVIQEPAAARSQPRFAMMDFTNLTGLPKMGRFDSGPFATSTNNMATNQASQMYAHFVYGSTTKATTLDFWMANAGALMATGTQIIITGTN